jgi:hypothetical protein
MPVHKVMDFLGINASPIERNASIFLAAGASSFTRPQYLPGLSPCLNCGIVLYRQGDAFWRAKARQKDRKIPAISSKTTCTGSHPAR